MTIRARGKRNGLRTAGLLLAAALLGGVLPAAAGTALDLRYGSPVTLLSPEVNAMGGTGAALYRGGVSNILNPAFLVWETGSRLDAAVSLEEAHEDRLAPLFDTFSETVAFTAIASNRHHYFGTGFGYARRITGVQVPLAVAISLTDRYSFAYDFSEEVRDPDPFSDHRDQLLQDRLLAVDGTLRNLSGGVAVSPWRFASFGASVHYAFGTRAEKRGQRFYVEPDSSVSRTTSLDLDGVNVSLGARFRLSERIEVGLAYETPLEVDGNLVSDTYSGARLDTLVSLAEHVTIHYPRIYRAGFTYRPRSEPRTIFCVDAVVTTWTDLVDSRVPGEDNPLRLEDTMDLRVGVEHIFYNDVSARFGFRHLDSYSDREAGMSSFSAGIGVPAAMGTFLASVELSKILSEQLHLFSYPNIIVGSQEFVSQPYADVEDTRFRFAVGFTRNF
jgi:hypothetical protein